jgi:membrane-associated phospholipid phosphatase
LTIATGHIEQNIIFLMVPNTFGVVAGIITVIAGVSSFPRTSLSIPLLTAALAMPTSRGMMHVHAWLVVIASLVLLVLGLVIWTLTLQEKNNIFAAYSQQTTAQSSAISALQEQVHSE